MQEMTSSRPYLLRAMYEWIVDNYLTPHLLVDATRKDVKVPLQYVKDGKIVLNLNPSAVRNLDMGNDWINFSARFSGSSFNIHFPVSAVVGIYARENGQGMVFQVENEPPSANIHDAQEDHTPPPPSSPPPRGKPVLKRVK
jgi:stringent starvation protein B